MTTSRPETSVRVQALDRLLDGRAIGPDDPLYDGAREVHNRIFDRRPAVIARCAGPADVGRAIAFAREHDLPLAVRGGGHSVAGFSSLEDGLVVDLSTLRDVRVDAPGRVVEVGGGATAGDLDAATHPFGLATPAATVSTVGVGGFTLGGGVGLLGRAHGLAADNLIRAEIVLADGSLVSTDERHEPDLLWGVRGGGGNFGVVTRMRMRLHPVRNVVGGPMLWPLEDTERVLPLYLRWLPEQPEDVYAFFMVLTVPPADPFPEAIRMRKACGLVWCITASPERAEAALDVFRAESPMLDGVDTLPYPALQSAFDPLAALGTHNAIAGAGFRSLPAAPAGAAFVRHQESAPTWLSFAHLYPLDGAAAREPEGGAAWPWREATFALMALGVRSEAGDDDELREWSASLCAELDPYALDGVYSNFLMDDGAAAAHASYGSSYERLARLKARVDPDNVFRANQNVEPAR